MSTKTYVCVKFLDLTTEVMVNGQIKIIRLKGGIMSPRRINGTYTTNDPDIQEAIEASPGFNKRYKLLRSWDAPKRTSEEPEKVITPDLTGPHNATEEATITGPTPETSPEAVVKEPDPVEKQPDPYQEHSMHKDVKKDKPNDDLADALPSPKEDIPEKVDESKEAIEDVPPSPIIDEAATSGQKARAFLVGHFNDVTVSKLRNNAMIRKLAKERNVEFPNWPEE